MLSTSTYRSGIQGDIVNQLLHRGDKPFGFWVSDEDEYGWNQWCRNADFRLDDLKYAHHVTLASDAKILYLSSHNDIDDFTEKYYDRQALKDSGASYFIFTIDWPKVATEYQGIIITPYISSQRLLTRNLWYNGWDCASGCIWDTSAIESLKLLPSKKKLANTLASQPNS